MKIEKLKIRIWRWTPRSKHYYCYIKIKKKKYKSPRFNNYIFACEWVERKIRKLIKDKKYWYIGGVKVKMFNDREQE